MLPAPSSPLPPGRRRALDETKLREICALITAGCGITGAARYVSCAPSTIRREARRNPEFNEKLRRAILAAQLAPLNALRDHCPKPAQNKRPRRRQDRPPFGERKRRPKIN